MLDGEVISWDAAVGQLDFEGLQARITAGRRIRAVAARRPAQLVVFDVLAAGTQDLRGRPLRERRAMLEQVLAGASSLVLCQQTADVAVAGEWFHTLTAGGIEGLVIKDAAGTYPTAPGQRVWWKVKAKQTLDMLAVGFTGDAATPNALLLAFPGDVDGEGHPLTAGSTTSLSKAVGKSLSHLLHPTGETFGAPSHGGRQGRQA